MRALLITGATGSLGSQILKRASALGRDVICLVRSNDRDNARARIQSFLEGGTRADVVPGDIAQALCGLCAADLEMLRGRVETILHCAASVDFTDAAAAKATNVEGVQHVLDLADALGVHDIRHVSTAYVAGDAPAFAETDFDKGQSFRNSYEQTKHTGERLVRDWAAQDHSRRYDIFRPSVLVGSGESDPPNVDPYFNSIKPLALVAEKLRQLPPEKWPEGVSVGDNGALNLPIVVHIPPMATLNLVSIEWAAERILALAQMPAQNRTYHLVHPEAVNVSWLWRTTVRALRIEGARVAATEAEREALVAELPPALARMQMLMVGAVAAYMPYTTGNTVFSDTLTRAAMQDAWRAPPAIDEAYIERILMRAMEAR